MTTVVPTDAQLRALIDDRVEQVAIGSGEDALGDALWAVLEVLPVPPGAADHLASTATLMALWKGAQRSSQEASGGGLPKPSCPRRTSRACATARPTPTSSSRRGCARRSGRR